jgi:hypothetical protein
VRGIGPRITTAVCLTCFRDFPRDPCSNGVGRYCSTACRKPRAFTGLERQMIASMALTAGNREIAMALGRKPDATGYLSTGGFSDITAQIRRKARDARLSGNVAQDTYRLRIPL